MRKTLHTTASPARFETPTCPPTSDALAAALRPLAALLLKLVESIERDPPDRPHEQGTANG
jgi:hypothetical protein